MTPVKQMPARVLQIRLDVCRQARCPHQADYADPCAACPAGHWGPWIRCPENEPPPPRTEIPDPPRATETKGGPGSELKRLLGRVGIHPRPGCACRSIARVMDQRGPDWCAQNIEKIVGWMRKEAGKRSFPYAKALAAVVTRYGPSWAQGAAVWLGSRRFLFAAWAARLAVRLAIKQARNRALKAGKSVDPSTRPNRGE